MTSTSVQFQRQFGVVAYDPKQVQPPRLPKREQYAPRLSHRMTGGVYIGCMEQAHESEDKVTNLELARFKIERMRVLEDLSLRRRELEIRDREVGKHTITPLTVTVIAGLVGLLGTGVGAYIQGRANRDLERQKFEAQLITHAIEVDDHDAAARNLLFLVHAGLINDGDGRITKLVKNPASIPIRNVAGESLIDVTDATFESEVLKSTTPTLVLFTAPWAEPGRKVERELLQLAAQITRVKIRRLNVDDGPKVAKRYDIKLVPTFILFADGVPQEFVYGAVPIDRVQALLERYRGPAMP